MNAVSAVSSASPKFSVPSTLSTLDHWVEKADALALSVGAAMKQADIQTDLSPSFHQVIGQTQAMVEEIRTQVARGKPLDLPAITAHRQAVVAAADEAMAAVPAQKSGDETPIGGSANQRVMAVTQTEAGTSLTTLTPIGAATSNVPTSNSAATNESVDLTPTVDLDPDESAGATASPVQTTATPDTSESVDLTPTVDITPDEPPVTPSAPVQVSATASADDSDLVTSLRASRAAFHTTVNAGDVNTPAAPTEASPSTPATPRPSRPLVGGNPFSQLATLLSRILTWLSEWLSQ